MGLDVLRAPAPAGHLGHAPHVPNPPHAKPPAPS